MTCVLRGKQSVALSWNFRSTVGLTLFHSSNGGEFDRTKELTEAEQVELKGLEDSLPQLKQAMLDASRAVKAQEEKMRIIKGEVEAEGSCADAQKRQRTE